LRDALFLPAGALEIFVERFAALVEARAVFFDVDLLADALPAAFALRAAGFFA
jgi:hypothetical protein